MQRDNVANAVAMGGITLVVLLLVVSLLIDDGGPAGSSVLEPVRIATGEWAPYSGEELPEFGIASAIVTAALKNAGYVPEFEFTPWPLAEAIARDSEANGGVRATFPYLLTENRSLLFYYSEPILQVNHSLYYNSNRFSLRELPLLQDEKISAEDKLDQVAHLVPEATVDDLRKLLNSSAVDGQTFLNSLQLILWLEQLKLTIVPINGYEVKDILKPYVAKMTSVADNAAAFDLLKNPQNNLVVLEATSVGDKLLEERFPRDYSIGNDDSGFSKPVANKIVSAPIRVSQPVYLIAGKRNPNNYKFIEAFNEALAELQAAGNLTKIENRVRTAIRNRSLVKLRAFDDSGYLVAQTTDRPARYLYIVDGTKARISEWNQAFLIDHAAAPNADAKYLMQVELEQGPHSGTTVYVDSRSIVIP